MSQILKLQSRWYCVKYFVSGFGLVGKLHGKAAPDRKGQQEGVVAGNLPRMSVVGKHLTDHLMTGKP